MQGWRQSRYLDNQHMSKGLECNACHSTLSPANSPTTATCLTCHKGSYAAVAELTARVSPNPHKSHEGEIPCAECHRGHQSFVYKCGGVCHTEYSNSRYQ
ncbi:MAG: cytochrome c3 family protein [Chloroflexi bacterium]|nr:cytochrome c3 family protein [Chloroflexota bacterium]